MKKNGLVICCLVFLSMALAGVNHDAFAWNTYIGISSSEGRRVISNGNFLVLQIQTNNPAEAQNAKSFRAWNADPGIDPAIYDTNWRLTVETRKTQTYYFHLTEVPYTGQHGVYNIEVTHLDDTVEVFPTPAINPLATPYTAPQDLEVSYSTGTTLPTFRFMPLAEPGIDYYTVRLRYWQVPYWESIEESEAEMVYRTAQITQWTPGQPIEVTFLQNSDGQGTETPLVPGVEYELRVDAFNETGASSPRSSQAAFQGQNRIYFRYPFSLYDDFSEAHVDNKKWKWGDLVREIDPVNQNLILKQATPDPGAIGAYPYSAQISLDFFNPNNVRSIQADVKLLEDTITNTGQTRARIAGRFFNDGTSGAGMIGDVYGEIALRREASGLRANWFVIRFTNADGSSSQTIKGGDISTSITTGTTYTLYIGYDQPTNVFTFRVEGIGQATCGPVDGVPDWHATPKMPWKGLGTRVQTNNASSSAFIAATFDNAYVNSSPYENFSSPSVDPEKWNTYEYVREVSDGQLRLKIRSDLAYTSSVTSDVDFTPPSLINNIQAKVILVDYQNPQELYERADIQGSFYNDGTAGAGQIGDVMGQIRIGGRGTAPAVEWEVYRFIDASGTTSSLDTGTFATPIVPNTPYTLFLGWDGAQITFRIDDEEEIYTPTTTLSPVKIPFKSLSARVIPEAAKKEATIEALYDDVRVNLNTKITVLTPNGGEFIPPKSTCTITWEAPPDMASFTLSYSLDKGVTWVPIANKIKEQWRSWTVPAATVNQDKCLIKVIGYDKSGKKLGEDKSDSPFSIEVLRILSPNGGDIVPSGSSQDITWRACPAATRFDLFYSMDKGTTWTSIAKGVTDTPYPWTPPKPTGNKTACLVRVVGRTDLNKKVGEDRSDSTFTLEVVKLLSPNGGEGWGAGSTQRIEWRTNGTLSDVAKVKLLYTLDGGVTWKPVTPIPLTGNPVFYDWPLPSLTATKAKCKVKVVLLDGNNKSLGSDLSDKFFTITK